MGIAVVSSVFPVVSAHAATQGIIGPTSSGNITINATINALVLISGLSDITFTTLDSVNDAQLYEPVCVWSNTSSRSYTIRAAGDGASSAFTLASTGHAPVPYSVAWANSSTATTGTTLAPATASAAFTSTAITPTCGAGASPTARLFVGISAANQNTMVANAAYTGILTLLVTPQ
ncbi:hypothetical protein [Novosphingobium barchaimii]|uniref:hypothetical protein n=1 Tax=Novosphingobium barchaimii TaxID=1420591 RepID=UPI0011DFC6DC|nr:hypothetical protein [Novosphingobium barchaimii]